MSFNAGSFFLATAAVGGFVEVFKLNCESSMRSESILELGFTSAFRRHDAFGHPHASPTTQASLHLGPRIFSLSRKLVFP